MDVEKLAEIFLGRGRKILSPCPCELDLMHIMNLHLAAALNSQLKYCPSIFLQILICPHLVYFLETSLACTTDIHQAKCHNQETCRVNYQSSK